MSPRRQREALAPSLFPFLAVLLCTMGALVLILMLIVSSAQASATKAITQQRERREEIESNLELSTIAFHQQLEDGRVELEKQRLNLQHFEEHILELTEELNQLKEARRLLTEDSDMVDVDDLDRQLSVLEEQLLKAEEELKQQVDEPEGDKPVFAIIPYQGRNGTHRRPIYLECDAQGVLIQPENVRLSVDDLRPPHGPGNPLDAALRAIRAEYKPSNEAVTNTAYPLLVVRPTGIKSYALARGALGSWDDQFGYELIDEDMELVFPAGVAGLEEKVQNAIQLAQQRQAALRLAMPNQYRGAQPLTGGSGPNNVAGSGENFVVGGQSNALALGGSTLGSSSFEGVRPQTGYPPSDGGDRIDLGGGWQEEGNNSGNPEFSGATSSREQSLIGSSFSGETGGAGAESPQNQPFASNLDAIATTGGGSAAGQSGDSASVAGNQASEGPSPNGFSSESPMEMDSFAESSGGGGAGAMRPGAVPLSQGSTDPSQVAAPQVSMNLDLSQPTQPSPPQSATRPVAAQQGSGWAWSRRNTSRTAVVRAIHLQCFDDRWVILPDRGTKQSPISIDFRQSPEKRALELAKHIQDRVDNWGIALAGGFWRPAIVVELHSEATWRYAELERLMQDSGIEVQLKTTGTANRPTSGVRRR